MNTRIPSVRASEVPGPGGLCSHTGKPAGKQSPSPGLTQAQEEGWGLGRPGACRRGALGGPYQAVICWLPAEGTQEHLTHWAAVVRPSLRPWGVPRFWGFFYHHENCDG